MATEPTLETSGEKLAIAEIERRYPNQWVVIADYDFPNMVLTAGVVYAHSSDRDSLRPIIRSLRDRAVRWTGKKSNPKLSVMARRNVDHLV